MTNETLPSMSMSSLLFLSFMIFLPILIYLISFLFINDEQTEWYNSLEFKSKINVISGYKAIFVGCVCFFATGLVGVLILKHQHESKEFSWKSLLLPLAVLMSNIGFVLAFQTETFTPHCVLSTIAATLTVFLMYHYGKNVSYTLALALSPLLLWQIFNIVFYSIGLTKKID